MKKTSLQNIGAILAAFILAALLSVVTDFTLQKNGFMISDTFRNDPRWVILSTIGLAGLLLSTLGTIVKRDKAVGWYNIFIVLTAVPCVWVGGKLKTRAQ